MWPPFFLGFIVAFFINVVAQTLGDSNTSDSIAGLKARIIQAKMPSIVEEKALKELSRLKRAWVPDKSIVLTYINYLLELPWNNQTVDNLDLEHVEKVLDENHPHLFKIRERVLEYLAVKKLKNNLKGPILCFYGPPGVGKTSLAQSIAKAIGRQFVRIALGGVRDETAIRGHSRTYLGALAGNIVGGLKKANTNNPVFLLDEIDKLSSASHSGGVSAALLEVLDPEQNHSFVDHYLDLPINLSNVMFIATCNDLSTIPSALKDRMEIIYLSGYTEDEKLSIAQKSLIPKQCEQNGVQSDLIQIEEEAIRSIIQEYTEESGVRNLERMIASLCRKTARAIAAGKSDKTVIKKENLFELLGSPQYKEDNLLLEKDEVGIATGLAWTAYGGQLLHIEVSAINNGKGAMHLTGRLGDVLRESALTALGLIRSKAQDWNIKAEFFNEHDIYVHFPCSAVPKEGPSAGIAIATAILSRITNTPIRKDFAMTGEVTLTGRILSIGGLKEKALAAMSNGIKNIIFPHGNVDDLNDISAEYREKLIFHPVKNIDEVWNLVLIARPASSDSVESSKSLENLETQQRGF